MSVCLKPGIRLELLGKSVVGEDICCWNTNVVNEREVAVYVKKKNDLG